MTENPSKRIHTLPQQQPPLSEEPSYAQISHSNGVSSSSVANISIPPSILKISNSVNSVIDIVDDSDTSTDTRPYNILPWQESYWMLGWLLRYYNLHTLPDMANIWAAVATAASKTPTGFGFENSPIIAMVIIGVLLDIGKTYFWQSPLIRELHSAFSYHAINWNIEYGPGQWNKIFYPQLKVCIASSGMPLSERSFNRIFKKYA